MGCAHVLQAENGSFWKELCLESRRLAPLSCCSCKTGISLRWRLGFSILAGGQVSVGILLLACLSLIWVGAGPSSGAAVPLLLHALRQGWRAGQWKAFLTRGQRHEVQELSDVSPAQILQFDFAKTRRFSQDTRGYRTVASLATSTPACFQNSRDETSTLCPWGCGALGHWHHVAWLCQNRPSQRCLPPNTSVGRRLGWVPRDLNAQDARSLVAWLEVVQCAIWRQRHGRPPED